MIPNYNHGRFLPRLLDSVLSQTFEDFELVVLDNASTDDSRDVVRRYARTDRRVRLRTRDATIPAADNFLEAAATGTGRYVKVMAADDRMFPRHLELLVAMLEAHPQVDIAGSWYDFEDAGGNLISGLAGNPRLSTRTGILPGRELIALMVRHANSFIGNPSQVLLRRQAMVEPFGRLLGRDYTQICDLATFVELLRRSDAAYVAETTSATTIHGENGGLVHFNTCMAEYNVMMLDCVEHGLLRAPEQWVLAATSYLARSARLLASIVEESGADDPLASRFLSDLGPLAALSRNGAGSKAVTVASQHSVPVRFLAVPDWADDAGLRTLVRAYVDRVAPGAAAELALAVDVEAVPVDDAFARVATILASVAGADGETPDVVLEPWRRADPLPVTPRTLLVDQPDADPRALPGLLRCPPQTQAFAWAVHHLTSPSAVRWE